MCFAQEQNTVTQVRLEPADPRSRVKHSTTEPLCPRLTLQFQNIQLNNGTGVLVYVTKDLKLTMLEKNWALCVIMSAADHYIVTFFIILVKIMQADG